MRRVRSAKGVEVDFDLIKIKEEIASGPKPVNVQQREDFIDRKNRRRVKKAPVPTIEVDTEVAEEPTKEADLIAEPAVETPEVEKEPVKEEPAEEPAPAKKAPVKRIRK